MKTGNTPPWYTPGADMFCQGLKTLKLKHMKEVYYKGQPYQYKIIDTDGKRYFQLYESGILKHSVDQGELDIRSIVSFILDSYYTNTPAKVRNNSFNRLEV